ncbi:PREDICTED: uncharacterized protein LOC109468175 [Branchiostoma belcheri]|uniref:DNA 3'-5' helicase n=1 Tax=Branchiostoma belcheri TaxID=7741 RepID=A0A6P4XZB4_BRABE|nr:PREDICTED: uncharacterized protein LOC109468175 [Branchiostoma belcheri]
MASSWEENFCDFFGLESLHDHQKSTLEFLMSGKDVFLSVRTGGGKDLCFYGIRLRVSPLNAIMKEHCEFLNGLGLTAVCLGMDSRDTAGILAGKFQFVLTSPETILGDEKFREMLRSDVYKGHVGLIVIDEAHTVVQW